MYILYYKTTVIKNIKTFKNDTVFQTYLQLSHSKSYIKTFKTPFSFIQISTAANTCNNLRSRACKWALVNTGEMCEYFSVCSRLELSVPPVNNFSLSHVFLRSL